MSRQDGATTFAVVGLVVTIVMASLLVADVGGYLAARLQAAAAADAAALAAAPITFRPFGAVGTPAREAERFATANGARLVACRCPVDSSWSTRRVEVVVARSVDLMILGETEVRATSRAEFVPTALPP